MALIVLGSQRHLVVDAPGIENILNNWNISDLSFSGLSLFFFQLFFESIPRFVLQSFLQRV
jgi:hypothetical protein